LAAHCFPEDAPNSVRNHLQWCLARIIQGRMVRLVAEVEEGVVANGQLDLMSSPAEIGSLVVAPPYRRRGLGTAMVQALVRAAQERRVTEIEIMADAGVPWIREWYVRLGFTCVDEKHWPRGEHLVVLRMVTPPHAVQVAKGP
jgi:GNAT superfamily N-acetyltransferase